MSLLSHDPSLVNTAAITFINKLKEEIDKYEDIVSSMDKAENREKRKNTKYNKNKLTSYSLLMNLGWIIGIIYLVPLIIHIKNKHPVPKEFLHSCNGTDFMSAEKYKQLKEDVDNLQQEFKIVDVIMRHNLSNENPISLLRKIMTYSNNLTSILKNQKEIQRKCYQTHAEKYIDQNSKHSIFNNINFCLFTVICIFAHILSFYYMVKISKIGTWASRDKCVFHVCIWTVFIATFDVMFILLASSLDSKKARERLPLDDL